MTITAHIEGLDSLLAEEFQRMKQIGQAAMATAFGDIAHRNFGLDGDDRAFEWPDLSPKYAKRVGRTLATEYLSGDLSASLQVDNDNPEFSEVSLNTPYAVAQHDGNPENNLPARPVFPILNKSTDEDVVLTPRAEQDILKAATDAINAAIS